MIKHLLRLRSDEHDIGSQSGARRADRKHHLPAAHSPRRSWRRFRNRYHRGSSDIRDRKSLRRQEETEKATDQDSGSLDQVKAVLEAAGIADVDARSERMIDVFKVRMNGKNLPPSDDCEASAKDGTKIVISRDGDFSTAKVYNPSGELSYALRALHCQDVTIDLTP